jgi:hypothetical protein
MFFLGLLMILFISYGIAKIGLRLIEEGSTEAPLTEEEEKASRERVVEYKAWIKGTSKKGKIKFAKTCVEDEHSPMVLFNRDIPFKVDSVICSKCTDSLPVLPEYRCNDCMVINLDGYLHIEACDEHAKELAVR